METPNDFVNPTLLANELGLKWRRGEAGECLSWDQFWNLLENKYWEVRCKKVA